MADLKITEFQSLGLVEKSRTPYPDASSLVNQKVAIGVSSANAPSTTTYTLIRLFAAANCHVSFDGTAATTDDLYLANGAELFVTLPPGSQIATIQG